MAEKFPKKQLDPNSNLIVSILTFTFELENLINYRRVLFIDVTFFANVNSWECMPLSTLNSHNY